MFTPMKKIALITLTLVSALASAGNYAVINQELVMFTSDVANAESERLQADLGGLAQERAALQAELEAMQAQYDTDREIMTEDELRELQSAANTVQQQLNQVSNQLVQAQQQREQAFLQRYEADLIEAIKTVLADSEYDLVLNSNAVIYAEDALDISQRVLEEFNQRTAGE